MGKENDAATSALEDNAEVILDKFANNFLNGDLAQVAGDMPIISTAKGVISTVYNIRNWRIARNVNYFVHALQLGKAGQQDYDELVNKYGREKILENVLLSLETMRSQDQAVALSCLFDALVKGAIDWQYYSELQNILEKIDPSALNEDPSDEPSYKLVTVGLAYIQTVYDGVKVLPNGKLYNDYRQYILEPYHSRTKQLES